MAREGGRGTPPRALLPVLLAAAACLVPQAAAGALRAQARAQAPDPDWPIGWVDKPQEAPNGHSNSPEETKADAERHEELRKVEETVEPRAQKIMEKGLDQKTKHHPLPNGTNITLMSFAEELVEMRAISTALSADLTALEQSARARQDTLSSWMLQYGSAQDLVGKATSLAEAKQPRLTDLAARKTSVQSEFTLEETAWKAEQKALEDRKAAEEARAAVLKACVEGRNLVEGTHPPTCLKDGAGEAELREALIRDVTFLGAALEREPWHIKRFQNLLVAFADEEKEVGANDLWYQKGARLQKNQEMLEDFSETIAAMELYFDYRHSNTLAELSGQKDLTCEMEIQPALLARGLLQEHTDYSPIPLMHDEATILHSMMEAHREYYHQEQHYLWRSLWMLRNSLEDVQTPHRSGDIECEEIYGKDWWAWGWCREAHMKLLRYYDDAPPNLEDRMTQFSSINLELEDHIASMLEQSAVEEDADTKALIDHEVTEAKVYLADVVQEVEDARWRLRQQLKFATWLHWSQGIPGEDWLKSNMTEMLEGKLHTVQEEIKLTQHRAHQFQIRQGRRILEVVDRKCLRMQEFFYKGSSRDATMNKLAYEAMVNASGLMHNQTRLETLSAWRQNPEHQRLLRRQLSRVRQQLSERWRP